MSASVTDAFCCTQTLLFCMQVPDFDQLMADDALMLGEDNHLGVADLEGAQVVPHAAVMGARRAWDQHRFTWKLWQVHDTSVTNEQSHSDAHCGRARRTDNRQYTPPARITTIRTFWRTGLDFELDMGPDSFAIMA